MPARRRPIVPARDARPLRGGRPGSTSSKVLAGVLSIAGLGLCMAATQARSRVALLGVDAAGTTLIVCHYLVLGAHAGAALTAFGVITTVAGLTLAGRARGAFWCCYPLAGLLALARWQGPADLLAAAGVLSATAAKHSRRLPRTRSLLAVAALAWGAYAAAAGSPALAAANVAYAAAIGWRMAAPPEGGSDGAPASA